MSIDINYIFKRYWMIEIIGFLESPLLSSTRNVIFSKEILFKKRGKPSKICNLDEEQWVENSDSNVSLIVPKLKNVWIEYI